MVIYVPFVGLLAAAPVMWILRDDANWRRVLIAVPLGIVSGVLASVLIGTVLMGGRLAFVDPTVATVLGVLAAVVVCRRQYGTQRAPNDLRG